MTRRFIRSVAWFHDAPGQPRLTAGSQVPWRRVWPVALLGLVIAGLLLGYRVGLPDEPDVSLPFQVGSQWGLAEAVAEHGGSVTSDWTVGYDGQWFLGQAYDPLVRGDIVTTFHRPQYRAMRVLFPAAGWLLAAGQPGAVPYALLVASMLAVALGCAACARVVSGYGRSPWWGLLFAVVPGVAVGVMYATAEPMALALVAVGLSLLLERRYGWAGVAFAGAALTKETYLAFALVAAVFVAVDTGLRRTGGGSGWDRWRWARRAAVVAGPGIAGLAAWWWYISLVVPESQRTPNQLLQVPGLGWWGAARTIVAGDYVQYVVTGPVLLVVTFVLLVVALVLALRVRQSVLAYVVFLWSTFALSLVSVMLERFLSSQRVLAPAVLAAGLFLVTAWPSRAPRRRTGSLGADPPRETAHSSPAGQPAPGPPRPGASPGAGPG